MEILISKSFEKRLDIFYKGYCLEHGEVSISIYAYSEYKEPYLMSIYIDAEGQCDREGYSFFKFESFDEMIEFIKSDSDTKRYKNYLDFNLSEYLLKLREYKKLFSKWCDDRLNDELHNRFTELKKYLDDNDDSNF